MTIIRPATTALPVVLACLGMASPAWSQQPKPQPKPAQTAAVSAEPSILGTYGDWSAYTAAPNGKKVCFVLAKPKSSTTNPPGRKRDPAYMFISQRPSENVKNEISVLIGYPFKANAEATAEIGTTKFAMYTQNDGAWIKNVAEEARLIDAMRKGADLTIKGVSGRGTQTSDQFSLRGLSEALARVDQECK